MHRTSARLLTCIVNSNVVGHLFLRPTVDLGSLTCKNYFKRTFCVTELSVHECWDPLGEQIGLWKEKRDMPLICNGAVSLINAISMCNANNL